MGGGVLSVIKNIVKHSTSDVIENHIIFTINKDLLPAYKMPKIEGATSQNIFYYSANWNFYYTCKKLAAFLPNENAVVVAHDWLELGMMSNLGLQNPVVQIVHGNYDYYYNLSTLHQNVIDKFICVSPVIKEKLKTKLSAEKAVAVQCCRFPVPDVTPKEKQNEKLKIVYASGNLIDDNKQFSLIPEINFLLQKNKVAVDWILVGKGKTVAEIQQLMNSKNEILFFEELPNDSLLELLATADIFILPSLEEGFPVAVVEAMKAGLVPLVTNWKGATEKLVIEGETGYYFEPGKAEAYAEKIGELNTNRNILNKIAQAAKIKANELFEPIANTKIIETVFLNAFISPRYKKLANKAYGSKLDEPYIPNIIVNTVRSFS